MNTTFCSTMVATGLFLVAGVMSSCADRTNGKSLHDIQQQDSLVDAALNQDSTRALGVVDSLESTNGVATERIAFYRALVYSKMGQKKKAGEWGQKALEGDVLQQEDVEAFYRACDLMFTALVYREDYEHALELSQRGLDVATADLTELGRHWMAVFLHDVGYCEMHLGRIDEAERCFSQSYIALKQMATNDHQYTNLCTLARVSYNIVDAYTSIGQYDKAHAWIESASDAVNLLAASPECTREMKEDYMGGLAIQKAMVLLSTGHREEADDAYDEALALGYADTDMGVLERATYLEKAKRWDDLAVLMPRLESLSEAWGASTPSVHAADASSEATTD